MNEPSIIYIWLCNCIFFNSIFFQQGCDLGSAFFSEKIQEEMAQQAADSVMRAYRAAGMMNSRPYDQGLLSIGFP